jgi:hypothetical protein
VQLHVDTDFGGDPTTCAGAAARLAGVEVVAVTTNLDDGGTRAGCARYMLEVAGRPTMPVVAGAECSLTTGLRFASTFGDARCWPASVVPAPAPPGHAIARLQQSIDAGATIVAIGGFTNLARLEQARPGSLRAARVVAMAGWLESPPPDMPQWGAEMDFNAQCDTWATEIVAGAAGDLTLGRCRPRCTHSCARDPPRPRRRRGRRRCSRGSRRSTRTTAIWRRRRALRLPDDLVNFHWIRSRPRSPRVGTASQSKNASSRARWPAGLPGSSTILTADA